MLFSSCSDDSADNTPNQFYTPIFTRFFLTKEANPGLTADIEADIQGNKIVLYVSELQVSDAIVPSFEGNFTWVKVDGIHQISGKSIQNFNRIVCYELTDNTGIKTFYNVEIKVLNRIPRIDIVTEGEADIVSKTEYVPARIKIGNCPEFGEIDTDGKVRGRGNATWTYPKKPYKIKFASKQSPFGFPANKDWVLLAESCDRTLLRTAYMCEISKALGIEYTVKYQYVDLFVNRKYMGTYIFTDFVERAKSRVVIEDEGFIVEKDSYYSQEPLFFRTDRFSASYTFKYPNANNGDIVKDDANFLFIVSYMNELEQLLVLLEKNPEEDSFLQKIDIASFVKWYLAEEILGNYDPNLYYVLPSRNQKLKMFPLWDAEWVLGLWPESAWGAAPTSMETEITWRKFYFTYLFKSPIFIDMLKNEWQNFRTMIPHIKQCIDAICEEIVYAQQTNFERWSSNIGQRLNIRFDTWEEEVVYINDFFDKRIEFLDNYFNSL